MSFTAGLFLRQLVAAHRAAPVITAVPRRCFQLARPRPLCARSSGRAGRAFSSKTSDDGDESKARQDEAGGGGGQDHVEAADQDASVGGRGRAADAAARADDAPPAEARLQTVPEKASAVEAERLLADKFLERIEGRTGLEHHIKAQLAIDEDIPPGGIVKKKLSPEELAVIAEKKKRNLVLKRKFFKPLESEYDCIRPLEPSSRAIDQFKPKSRRKSQWLQEGFLQYYDVVVIGGGIMGCSVAYHLSNRIPHGDGEEGKALRVAVIEKDPTYRSNSSVLSVGGLRQQFSLPENIEMSLFGADFLRNANKLLYVHKLHTPNIQFQPHGYLFLATDAGAEAMEDNHRTQVSLGAKVELLTPKKLKHRFPWINADGIALASYGYENEGWFDPWALLTALRLKCVEQGRVDFIEGEVINVAHTVNVSDRLYKDHEEEEDEQKRLYNRPEEVHIELPSGDIYPIQAPHFVIAAGAESGDVAHRFGIGAAKTGILQVPCPVEPRKRFVYTVHAPTGPGLDCPLVVDPTGVYFRREGHGGNYICGRSPPPGVPEPRVDNTDVDYDFFDEHVWPILAHRVKAFENLKVKSAWAGFYDYNRWDENAIIGSHPGMSNVLFATGCSGHGIQQAPAIGRAIMELLLDDGYQTLDLSNLAFDRIVHDVQLRERNIV